MSSDEEGDLVVSAVRDEAEIVGVFDGNTIDSAHASGLSGGLLRIQIDDQDFGGVRNVRRVVLGVRNELLSATGAADLDRACDFVALSCQ